jgi:hypothetical protein
VDKTNTSNLSPLLTWEASITAPSVDLTLGLYEQVQVTGARMLWDTPPPWFFAGDGSWRLVSSRRVPSQ